MCFLYTREEVVYSQDNFPTRCVFSIAVRQLSETLNGLGSALRTTSPRDVFSLYREAVVYDLEWFGIYSQDNFPTRCVFSIPVRKLSTLRTTSPRDVFSL